MGDIVLFSVLRYSVCAFLFHTMPYSVGDPLNEVGGLHVAYPVGGHLSVSKCCIACSSSSPPLADFELEATGTEAPSELDELSCVAQPADPRLLDAYMSTELAPRVALLCGLYGLAQDAGCVDMEGGLAEGEVVAPPLQDTAVAAVAETASSVTGQAAKSGFPVLSDDAATAPATAAATASPPRRPVIIFHEEGGWGAGAATSWSAAPMAVAAASVPAAAAAAACTVPATAAADMFSAPPPPPPPLPPAFRPGRSPPLLPAVEEGLALWQDMLEFAMTDPLIASDKVKLGTELHRKKVGA